MSSFAARLGRAFASMRSGGGVLCISVLQFLVGLSLLIIYESYKVRNTACAAQPQIIEHSQLIWLVCSSTCCLFAHLVLV